jgi:hypothetical protein
VLTRGRRLAVVLAVVLAAITLQAGPAFADGSCGTVDCETDGNLPGNGGNGGGGGGGGGGGNGCAWQGVTVPCDGGALGWFNNSDGCYWLRVNAPNPDEHNGQGGWYEVTCTYGPRQTLNLRWSATSPVGPSPEELAQRALAKITLKGAAIRMAPDPAGAGLVGLPVWMWTEVNPNTWGPITASDSAAGLTVTITGKAASITWSMGDGHTVTCTSPGTPFRTGNGGQSSPDCGYTYATSSRTQPGGKYTVTTTTAWVVTWAGGGQTGVINTTRTSQTTVQIDELQVVTR